MTNLANLYQQTDRLQESENLYQEAFEIYKRLAQSEPESYGEKLSISKYNLAYAYYKSGQIKKSLPFWVEILDEFGKLANDNPDKYKKNYEDAFKFVKELAPWLVSEADDLKDEKKYEESEAYYKNALDMYRWFAKSDPKTYEPEIAMTLNDLGVLYHNTQRYTESETTYKEALEIKKRITKKGQTEQEASLAYTVNNLAYLYWVIKRYPESIIYYNDALEIARKLVQQDPQQYQPLITKVLYYLSSAYSNVGDHQHSYEIRKEYLTSQKALYESQPDNNRKSYARTMGSQSYQCLFIGHYEEAEQLARESIAIDESQHWLATNLATALLFQGRYNEAEAVYLQYKDELKDSFLGDFKAFEDADVIPEEHHAEVERIKQLLNN